MSIKIFYDDTSYKYKGWKKVKELLTRILDEAGKKPGKLNVVITSDENLKAINVQFLEHDYYTDVITFNYNDADIVNGEIYISADTVRINSQNYKVSFNNEMTRVIIHGVLHLLGHDDKTESQKASMRSLEDKWLNLLEE